MSSLGITPATLLFLAACVVGGLLRVLRAHGLKGLRSRYVVADTVLSSASGVVYPYLVPGFVLDRTPAIVVAVALLGLTYAGNLTIINLARRFGLLPENGKPPENGVTP